ncbi:MAG: sigma-70 family RNA polymerase sigma factor [Rhizobacter sp.]|nr:sigma-70 family RNA polymerase sigma factor [Rhizobacter sp.]
MRPAGEPGRPRAVPPHIAIATPADDRMPDHDELDAWMHAVASAGDRTAFAALFRHFAPRLKSFLVRSGASEAVAEELAQEAMVQLWRRAASYDPTRARVSTWLYTIVRNLRIDHHRRQLGLVADSADLDEAADIATEPEQAPDALLLVAQRERCVRQALAALPPEQAQVLRLSFYEEHAHPVIAASLGIPLGTVKSRIRLAMAQLRRLAEGLDP